ncbi:TIGR02099 family protein [Burkholderia multivorans]|uniref:TIGR02099 family protein n=1 Tax=Burkholderia multivorans TaxID=87883 RepID=A0AAP2MLF3_9BURK|nr:YhdP family protein [Burkholderia multivorans]MBU9354901.1 TIGR02099 family protein [Burkholderia multivorans]MBU9363940.1 TIGR02099 family protein [Burkholderia multivorans]MBU9595048.1 TIGR02099 family protein [Burkholderia multivorans]MCA8486203.1 TIGR02099 family protein [Burkholderia multivorans]MDN7447063.1 YhdP family protein [Burkholderia multivorans]
MSDRQESAAAAPEAATPKHDHPVLRRVFKVTLAVAIGTYFVACGTFLGLRYVLLPRIDEFRPRIERAVSDKLHAQLSIGKLSPHWSGMQPGVEVTRLTIRGRDGQVALSVPHATAALSWMSLLRLSPALSSLIVDEPDLVVARAADGSLSIAGVGVASAHGGNDTFGTWLLKQEAIVLRGGTLRWRDAQHDAPELALSGIRLAVLNDGRLHKAALQAPANGTLLLGPLDFRARFTHKALAPIGKPSNWTGNAYLSTGPVDLQTLARYVDMPLTIHAGRIDNAIWATFSNGRLRSAGGDLQGADVALRVRPTQPRLDVPTVGFRWDLALDPGRDYTLHLTHFNAELGQPPLPDGTPLARSLALSTLKARYRVPTADQGQLLSVVGDRVDLGILSEFIRGLPLPARLRNELVKIDPRGMMSNYHIEVERAKPARADLADEERRMGAAPIVRYRFLGDLQGISFAAQEPPPGLSARGHPRAGLPGVENLWGRVDASETGGTAEFDTVDAAVTVPGEFDEPRLTFDKLRGRANWTITPAPGEKHARVDVNVPDLFVANPDAEIAVSGTYTNPGHGRGSLDLRADFARASVARIPRYLPTGMSDHLRAYLGHALQDGRVTKGASIVARGPLDKFPFQHEPTAGVFRIVAPFTGGRFEPTPYPPRTLANGTPSVWPALDGIDGVFELAQNKLRFDIDRAHYKRVAVTKVAGRIDDLGHPSDSPLVIEGHAQGPLADLIDYADNSSLGAMSDHVGARIDAQGPASLALKLTIPQHVAHPHTRIEGALAFGGNTLSADGVPPLSALRGQVRFTETGASLHALSGRFLGGPVRANGGFQSHGPYAVDVDGKLALDAARGLNLRGAAAALLEHVSGDAPYRIAVRGAPGRLPDIAAQSDLTGVALNFPAPFAKPAGTTMPFRFTLQPAPQTDGTRLEHADLTLGPVSATYLLDATRGAPLRAVRGAMGIHRMPDMPQEGVSAAVDVDAFDADAWIALARTLRAETPRATQPPAASRVDVASFAPKRFALHFGTLTLLKRNWENVIVGASHVDDLWQANIASNQVSGYLSWAPGGGHNGAGVLNARLAKLVIPDSAQHDLVGRAMNLPTPTDRPMPSVDVIVDQVVARNHDIGRLVVNARNVDENGTPVWQLDRLTLTNPDAKLSATGNWRTSRRALARGVDESEAPRRSVFDFRLDVDDAGALLDRVGLPRTLAKGQGSVTGKVGWRGGPTAVDLPSLNGQIALDLEHGQILKVDPGAAKLLGVLSLQSLARFLTLNFRDVIGKGLPFDKITGTARVSNGIARTDDFAMTTAPANVTVRGAVDLGTETQDLHAHVAPKVGAGAAAIAAAVINPLLGVGVLAADFALSQTLQHAFALDYAITGSWAHPHIERVRGDQGKMNRDAAEAPGH